MQEAVAIVFRQRAPQSLPSAPPDERVGEVDGFDLSYLELVSPYSPGDELEEYLLEELLGRGGFGEVWRASDEAGDEVAIKIGLGPGAAARLRHEAELGQRLSHPRIPAVLSSRLDLDPPLIVCELMAGTSLRAVLHEQRQLPIEVCLQLLRDLVGLIAHCHDSGVVHRDLKPENILVDEDGAATLLDFGLGQLVVERPVAHSLVSVELGGGTFDYMAPEHADEDAGPAVDLYALGVIAYEALTGGLPGAAARLRDRLPSAPHWLEEMLERLLSRDPARRGAASQWLVLLLDPPEVVAEDAPVASRFSMRVGMGLDEVMTDGPVGAAVCGALGSMMLLWGPFDVSSVHLVDRVSVAVVAMASVLAAVVLQLLDRATLDRPFGTPEQLRVLGYALRVGVCTSLAAWAAILQMSSAAGVRLWPPVKQGTGVLFVLQVTVLTWFLCRIAIGRRQAA